MPNNNDKNNNTPLSPEEAITEINLGDFLEGDSAAPADGQALASELENLYEDIVGDGSDTIVPKPMSVITSPEPEAAPSQPSSLSDMWMNPDDYFEDDIPVVSLDGGEDEFEQPAQDMPEEAFFAPEAELQSDFSQEDSSKSDIFDMINSLKSETDSEDGFNSILSEIEANEGIATVAVDVSAASQLVTKPEAYAETLYLQKEEQPAAPASDVINIEASQTAEKPEINEFEIKEDYEDELSRILSNDNIILNPEPQSQADAPSDNKNFVIDIPEESDNYVPAPPVQIPPQQTPPQQTPPQPPVQNIYTPGQQNSSITYFTQEEFEKKMAQQSKAAQQNAPKTNAKGKKPGSKGDLVAKIVLPISILVIVACSAWLVKDYVWDPIKHSNDQQQDVDTYQQGIDTYGVTEVVNEQLKKDFPDVVFPDGMLAKYASLYAENDDLRGWITIGGDIQIDLPIVQGEDNKQYLRKDVRGNYTTYGVPFFDYRMTDFKNLHTNNTIYGHNMRSDDYIFGMLEDYRKLENLTSESAVIKCNTIYGDFNWFVYAVYITNADPDDDNGYYFPYNFVDLSKENFEGYIEEIDKRKFYTTGVDINSDDKILTLSTCCYDFNDARLVVVARLQREGESLAVDTSKAYVNSNPKYPQAWYDEMDKTNPYAGDARWDPTK